MKCAWRWCNQEVVGGRKVKFCSRLCSIKQSTFEKRHRNKKRAVEMLGGSCSQCGYAKCLRALQFHRVDPTTKKFQLSASANKPWRDVEEELKKCILLCANCHAEQEDLLSIAQGAANTYKVRKAPD